jgi:DMSO/TMAO reductase YedYZ molybdopterin-dependent catalytic subunit
LSAPSPAFEAPLVPHGTVRRFPLAAHETTARITPQPALFVLAHLGIPQIDPGAWRLEVGGLVAKAATLTLGDIRALPRREVESFHHCAGAPRRPDLAMRRVGNVVWGGADLADLLRGAGIAAAARYLWAYGLDHGEYDGVSARWYVKDLSLERLAEGGVLLAYEMNGEALTPEHGFPLRLIVPGFYGTNTVKWLWRLELAAHRADGPFTTELYNDPVPGGRAPVWEAPPEALIVAPTEGPLALAPCEIWGWAWAAAGVARVAISTDDGASWRDGALELRRQWSWQRFSLPWTPPARGRHTILARATDARSLMQPMAKARNSVHRIAVEVG